MEDVTTYPWLALRGRTFYLRAPVPQDIQTMLGKAEIWKSLRTQDRRAALDRLRKESAAVTSIFEEHRRELARLAEPPLEELSDAQLKAVGDAYFVHLLEEDDGLREDGFEGEDFDAHADDIDALDEVNRQEFARGIQSEFMKDEAREVLSWANVNLRLAEGSASWPKLLRAIYAAGIKAAAAKKQRNAGEVVETPPPPPIETKASKPTLEEAKNFYITERVSGSEFSQRKRKARLEAMMRTIKDALWTIPDLPDWTIEDAYKVRDHLLAKGTLKPSSVRRELNDIKGVFSLYKAKRLRSMDNPFSGLDLPQSTVSEKEVRDALPVEVILAVRGVLIDKANPEINLVWQLLEGTGCRLAEVTGLRIQDIVTEGDTPHLKIVGHDGRRLKSKSSKRDVPLVGETLSAAKKCITYAGDGHVPFARYSGPAGPNAASQLLMKWLRTVTTNPLHAVHSLRHNMADRCDLAGVNPIDKAAILGHLAGGASEKHYGTDAVKRIVLGRVMNKAFGLPAA